MPTPTATVWTGNAGNGLWSDPGNWTNGVPVSGEFYTVDGQDEATIDAVATTVVIAGVQAVQDLIVDTANPASGAAVELTAWPMTRLATVSATTARLIFNPARSGWSADRCPWPASCLAAAIFRWTAAR